MSDSLGNFILQYSSIGEGGPWTNTASSPLSPSATSDTSTIPVIGMLWYKLTQTTSAGVSVPYSVVSIINLPQGHLEAGPDPTDPNTLIFTWTIPDGLPAPIGYFEMYGRFLNDPDSEAIRLDAYGASERTARLAVVPTDDLTNPYTYQLIGFIPR